MTRTLLDWQDRQPDLPIDAPVWLPALSCLPQSRSAVIGQTNLTITQHPPAAAGGMSLPGMAACKLG